MSYTLHLWERPVPADLDEALALHESLAGQHVPQVAAFLTLASRLAARYPSIRTQPDDDGVWSDGPLDGRTDEPVYSIGIRSQALDEVAPFVVETARALGLTVLDEQAGVVYLPDGRALDHRGAVPERPPLPSPLPASTSRPTTLPAMRDWLMDTLGTMLEPHGFGRRSPGRATPAALVRPAGETTQVVSFSITDYAPAFVVSVYVGIAPVLTPPWSEWAPLYLDSCMVHLQRLAQAHALTVLGADGGPAIVARIDSLAPLERWQAELPPLLNLALLPLLDRCRTLEALDAEVNAEGSPFHVLQGNLMLAAVVGRTDLDAVAERIVRTANNKLVVDACNRLLQELRRRGVA